MAPLKPLSSIPRRLNGTISYFFCTFHLCSGSIFVSACVKAVSGEASLPENPVVTVVDFVRFLVKFFQKFGFATVAIEQGNDHASPALLQIPVLFIPDGMEEMAFNPVCHRCCEPPAPNRPEVIKVGRNEVEICWTNPEFDGALALNFRVSMRNSTRNFNHWKKVDYPGIISPIRFIIRNMPSGVHSKFRVEAFNRGGWSNSSDETEYFCPGLTLLPADPCAKWNRIAKGGPLSVVDYLMQFPFLREDCLRGLRLLIVFGQRDDGFHKGLIQLKVARVCTKAILIYKNDPEVNAYISSIIIHAFKDHCTSLYGTRIRTSWRQFPCC